MIEDVWLSFMGWLASLQRLAMHSWNTLTPMQYGGLLITISVIGFATMKGVEKRV